MKKLVSNTTMIALTLATLIPASALTPRANTNSRSSAPAEESVPVVAGAPAMAYPRATIHNRTIFPAKVQIYYPGCRGDSFSVPAGVLQKDGLIQEGVGTAPTTRGGCLIRKIDAQLTGAGKPVTSYTSSGTSYSNFIIQGTETDFRVWSDHELAAENASRAGTSTNYSRANIHNRTIFPATGKITYNGPFCRDDSFSVPAGVLQEDGSIKEGFWQAQSRGLCGIKRIDAQLSGAGKGVTSYTSFPATIYSNFIIQGTETDFRVWSTHELAGAAAENANREGKSPGFSITNKTKWPVSIGLSQIGCLYYGTIKPGDVFKRNTGAVWFTIKATIQPNGLEPRTDWDCIQPVVITVANVLLAAGMSGNAAATYTLAQDVVRIFKENGNANLVGQYAGPDWPFRCNQMPTYEIVGGPDKAVITNGEFIMDPGTPLRIIKVNNCGNSMMR